MDEWGQKLRRDREQKDTFFAEHPKSPLSAEAKQAFDGVEYYEPNPEYRFIVGLEREPNPKTVAVLTTDDGTQTYERCGWFPVELDGTEYRVWAYRNENDERL